MAAEPVEVAAELPGDASPEEALFAACGDCDAFAEVLAQALAERRAALHAIARQGGPKAQLAKRALSFESATAAAWKHGFAAHFGLWHCGWRDRRSFTQMAEALLSRRAA
ncbi:MAG TPA: hypothetical protein VGG79_02235 [Roseiarcus sp.]